KTRVRYQLDGYQGELTVAGREYIDGVIVADQRKPERALCVTSFPYDLNRDSSGNWTGRLRVRLVIGMVFWLLVMIGWLWGAVFTAQQAAIANVTSHSASGAGSNGSTPAPTMTPKPGDPAIVNGANETRSI